MEHKVWTPGDGASQMGLHPLSWPGGEIMPIWGIQGKEARNWALVQVPEMLLSAGGSPGNYKWGGNPFMGGNGGRRGDVHLLMDGAGLINKANKQINR